ncbi:MAG TPA: ATP-dependent Clp protease ATP-binding subunit [Clostridia bacterium]|jgi:ATP-dependent Clp protease ATP-binding subunit ClpE|nr:ATP-dependent Clp protease ATP-binding subunit [Clostridia bacterium]HOM33710.1 ATP-dependent Clp protease ATP-binding subunit [Clostridia bacterium]HOR88872.1 ATP-dependent Clp protease ATP-binding subunit [Clostridia bacterium]HOT71103.1 ATP-dependent Clp protease ATP-binding subunit [Clostridia bacterium]HPL07198.1 ATP-dependent Clp protease ATP-binding subunit [Clostridia bacterium]
MKLCDICKKNVAVVFVTRIQNNKHTQIGYCIPCAKTAGISPIDHLIKNTGMSDEELGNINNQMGQFLQSLDFDDMVLPNNFRENILPSKSESSKKTKVKEPKKDDKRKFLDAFGTNLNKKAMEGKIDNIIGRTKEIDRMIQILNRRQKNNPCLIGEAGVGKTAIAEGLALKIVNQQVPAKLLNKEIYVLDMTGIVAGTQFRGQFESRMRNIINEVKELGNIILVIDEIHNIISAGDAEGGMNAANILKPALSRGEVQIIGATTIDEYRRHIEKDSALERRFQPIMVDEPSVQDTIEILHGIKKYYEQFHFVTFSDEAIRQAAILSERYIPDRFLPDKAIDVIDEAASRANLNNEALVKLQMLNNELDEILQEKESAASADSIDDYKRAAELKEKECRVREDIQKYKDILDKTEVTVQDIADVIEMWTKVPVTKITQIESAALLDLEKKLEKKIVGQKQAIHAVAKSVRRARSGIKVKKRPASFIFVGPTGVGKTYLAKILAQELFVNEESMIRLDMSEYMEKHSVSKLIGSPPGYIGYDETGQLTEKVRRNPYSLLLFDEIEKAHPDVFNILLQILEDGRLTDSKGRVVKFENTIIIMTSNAGTSYKNTGFGYVQDQTDSSDRVRDALKEIFRPEFLNRVDDIIVFTSLSEQEIFEIGKLMAEEYAEDLKEKNILLKVSDQAVKHIIGENYDDKYGARPLRRSMQTNIEDVLSEMYIKNELKDGMMVMISVEDGTLKYECI